MLLVAGIIRSGLSLTMQMLCAGGYPCRGEPPAFEPYPAGDIPWDECQGHAVKLVDAHEQLPPTGTFDVIRLRRNLTEQARSFNKFSCVIFGADTIPTSRLVGAFRRDYAVIDEWLRGQRSMVLDFETIITNPITAAIAIQDFVGDPLDIQRMAACVLRRDPQCNSRLLELDLIKAAREPGR
ncbi:hypothetical protein LCGC14_1890270 [marine sediment metagenome]|uniref:Sulfotransferase family protein n=1 Tax=marine sediment metagenome TaxID=412755 RepID=A0A0F9FZN1_9ZZZZ